MPAPSNPDVAWAIEDIRAKLKERQRALDYYDGNHPLNFASRKFRNTFGELFQEFADNLCDDVVDVPADRLQIKAWSGSKGAEAQTWWEANKMDARSGATHQHGFRSGDGFVIVWDDAGDGIPRPYIQDPRQMAVRYSQANPDNLEVAAKCWRSGKGYRLNLYYPPSQGMGEEGRGRIERYYSKGWSNQTGEKGIPNATAFLPYATGAEDDPGRVEAVEFHDHGMPVFHFPNGELSGYGSSVLKGVYPLQDALNKSVADMLVAGEAWSLPKRWGTGIEVRTDPVTGQEEDPFKDDKSFWWTKAKDAMFGQFPAADRKGFLEEQDAWRLEIARKGALPPHSIKMANGSMPSGLSLLVAEGKLIKRVKDRQRDWGPVWRALVAYALSWDGGGVTPDDLDIEWEPAETRDVQAHLEELSLKKSLGVPVWQLLTEAGYDHDQLLAFAGLSEDEKARELDAAFAASGGRISAPGGALVPQSPAPPGGAAEPAVTTA